MTNKDATCKGSWQLIGLMDTGRDSARDSFTVRSKVARAISAVNAPVQLLELRRAVASIDSSPLACPLKIWMVLLALLIGYLVFRLTNFQGATTNQPFPLKSLALCAPGKPSFCTNVNLPVPF